MTILLTGTMGFLGSYLLYRLLKMVSNLKKRRQTQKSRQYKIGILGSYK